MWALTLTLIGAALGVVGTLILTFFPPKWPDNEGKLTLHAVKRVIRPRNGAEWLTILGILVIFFGVCLTSIGAFWSERNRSRAEEQLRAQNIEISDSTKQLRMEIGKLAGLSSDIGTKTAEIQRNSTALLDESAKISRLTAENLRQLTSEGSFCSVAIVSNDPQSDRRLLMIRHHGKYPLYDVQIRLHDPDGKQIPTLTNMFANDIFVDKVPSLPPNQVLTWKMLQLPKDLRRKQYTVFIAARNGFWHENIDLIKSDNGWTSAFRIIKDQDNRVIFESSDAGFPNRVNGKVRWANPRTGLKEAAHTIP